MGAANPGTGLPMELWFLCATIKRRAQADVLEQPTCSFISNRRLPPISHSPPPKFQKPPEAAVFFKKGQLGIICSQTNLGKRLEIQRWLERLFCKGKVDNITVFLHSLDSRYVFKIEQTENKDHQWLHIKHQWLCFIVGCLTDLRQVEGTLNVAEGEECLHDPLGYYPWLASEGRQEKKGSEHGVSVFWCRWKDGTVWVVSCSVERQTAC